MLGSSEQPGIMFHSISDLVEGVRKSSSYEYTLRMWYVEVYNECLKDLLAPGGGGRLEIREDFIKGATLAGAKEVLVTTAEDIMDLLKFGNRNRTKESTWANEASSRSHAVLQVTVERKDRISVVDTDMLTAKLTLIDLAGSERASVTKNKGMRLIEGANINRSLLALANCINALAAQQTRQVRESHVPYRDSKLTRLLKETLGGKCRTVMIANISPSIMCYEDTLNTLKYANRAKQIKTSVSRNVLNVQKHINDYQGMINQLRGEVSILRKQLEETKIRRVERMLKEENGSKRPEKEVRLYYPSERLRKIEGRLNEHFEREIKIKKKVLEVEQESQRLGFELFSLQLQLSRSKNADSSTTTDSAKITKEIEGVRRQIENNGHKVKAHLQSLQEMEDGREAVLDEIKQNMLNSSIDHEAFKFLLKNQISDSLQVDYERNNLRALFLLRQRENYIDHLKSELSRSYFCSLHLQIDAANINQPREPARRKQT